MECSSGVIINHVSRIAAGHDRVVTAGWSVIVSNRQNRSDIP
jgi:hypothetical protein